MKNWSFCLTAINSCPAAKEREGEISCVSLVSIRFIDGEKIGANQLQIGLCVTYAPDAALYFMAPLSYWEAAN